MTKGILQCVKFSAIGILANLVVILVIIVTERSRSHRTVANTFVLQLAIADVLFLITLPFHIPSSSNYEYQFSQAACKFTEGTIIDTCDIDTTKIILAKLPYIL